MFLPKEDGCRHVSRAPITNQFTPLFQSPHVPLVNNIPLHIQVYNDTLHAADVINKIKDTTITIIQRQRAP